MERGKYFREIDNVLENLRQELFDIIKRKGIINLSTSNGCYKTIGSYRTSVVENIYVKDNKLMLTCSCYGHKQEIVFDGDKKNNVRNVGYITKSDYFTIYDLVCDNINKN